jgi:hypothetical protein
MPALLLLILFSACGASFAQGVSGAPGSVDAEITIVGRDDAVIAVPPPWVPEDTAVPDVVAQVPESLFLPPIPPPTVDWAAGLPAPLPADEKRATPS